MCEFDRGAFVREVNIKSWSTHPSLEHSHERGAGLWASIHSFFTPGHQWEQPVRDSERMEKDIRLVTDAIRAMPQLCKCSLGCEDESYHPRFYRALLTPIFFAHIKDNLHSLALNVPPEVLHVMPSVDMPRLESLSVGLCTNKKAEEEINRIFDSFVVFVNNLLGSLESLSIASRAPSQSLKLDRFFKMLGTFPHLQSFSLSIPFDGSHLSSPDQVVNFLNKHRHMLKHLRLHASRCLPVDTPVDADSKYWIPNTLTRLSMISYPQLYDLDLAVRPMMMDLTPLIRFFELQALDSLTLTERALTYDEVKAILDVTCKHPRGLKQLRLRVKYLNLDLLELLARMVPRLSLLELKFGETRSTVSV
ncbi:hypothetical protein C0993_000849 [Termitomyces sp. T159_Od127]|nr:hypothetical protein C0993_000849 [Termitomyces sp. T159_Od127]